MSFVSPTPASSPVSTAVKFLSDNWLNRNPLQVQSCFSIQLSWTTLTTGQFQSEACGLGWSFAGTYESFKFERVEMVKKDKGFAKKGRAPTFRNPTVQKCRCKVSLSLHPGAIRAMPFGNLHVKASVSEETVEHTFKLPIELPEIPLGDLTQGNLSVYENLSFDVTVTLNVPAERIPILIAPDPTASQIMEVVTASLDGEFPIDIKFVLFTHRSGKGRAYDPRAVFATSRVLKGRGAFIDEYVMEGKGVDIDRDNSNYGTSCDYPFEDDSDLESDGEPEVLRLDGVDEVEGEHPSGDLPEGSDMIIDAAATGEREGGNKAHKYSRGIGSKFPKKDKSAQQWKGGRGTLILSPELANFGRYRLVKDHSVWTLFMPKAPSVRHFAIAL
ncbi:hypothetical protein IW261DRAFT_1596805 [Armillaria novae-zelandiae]|uniref:Uncharacterized protein n=1 Tax=Armillaria novae-zelandiae TaxID=153914 RepID=A0AA39NVK6_9AGAR|nr:hypothetical protein IW261DRAFT_1596805 [Armillaria novae-zelandiae]